MTDIEAITFAAKHGILNLYKKGFSDGNKAANKKIKPLIQEIHDNVYEEGIRKGKAEPIDCTGCNVMSRAKLVNKFQWRKFTGTMPYGYDWVLVCNEKGNKPRIAEFKNGQWHTDDEGLTNLETWYEVKYWKPIYDESVPCCGLSETDWADVMRHKNGA